MLVSSVTDHAYLRALTPPPGPGAVHPLYPPWIGLPLPIQYPITNNQIMSLVYQMLYVQDLAF